MPPLFPFLPPHRFIARQPPPARALLCYTGCALTAPVTHVPYLTARGRRRALKKALLPQPSDACRMSVAQKPSIAAAPAHPSTSVARIRSPSRCASRTLATPGSSPFLPPPPRRETEKRRSRSARRRPVAAAAARGTSTSLRPYA
jgi:hypothetical protein